MRPRTPIFAALGVLSRPGPGGSGTQGDGLAGPGETGSAPQELAETTVFRETLRCGPTAETTTCAQGRARSEVFQRAENEPVEPASTTFVKRLEPVATVTRTADPCSNPEPRTTTGEESNRATRGPVAPVATAAASKKSAPVQKKSLIAR
jgi:hypothetical protein